MGHDQGMQRWQVWPARYRVTARSGLGPTRNLRDVTWLCPQKAFAVAVRAGGRGYGTSDGIDDGVVYGRVHISKGCVITGCFGHAVRPRSAVLSGA